MEASSRTPRPWWPAAAGDTMPGRRPFGACVSRLEGGHDAGAEAAYHSAEPASGTTARHLACLTASHSDAGGWRTRCSLPSGRGITVTRDAGASIDDTVVVMLDAQTIGASRGWRDLAVLPAGRYWRGGGVELYRSMNRRALARALRRLVQRFRSADLVRTPAGVRAQALGADLGVGLEREEAVAASPRHVELGECARVQVEAQPLPERRRVGSEVDDHVERGAGPPQALWPLPS